MQLDRYSRFISWLKVLLPLMALGLLSTLFLLSRVIDPEAAIPFADVDIQERLRDQQVTGPFFSGTTTNGDQISFSAEKLTTPQGKVGSNEAQDVHVVIDQIKGAVITLHANSARFDIAQDVADLMGEVHIVTANGYELRSEHLSTKMSALSLVSPGEVEGYAPFGIITAGGMTLNTGKDDENAQLLFTNGVKLIYTPKQEKE